jgi:flagellar biogenesis protein FliO
MGVAASVIALTAPSRAEAPAPSASPAPSVASSDVGTPLSLRPAKPLELAPAPEAPSTAWKFAALLAVAGGAAFYFRKRRASKPERAAELTIVRRAAVGLRSELLVVNVEGQRLLIGVTPQSISSLAILDGDERTASDATSADPSMGARVEALLGAAEDRRPVKLVPTRAPAPTTLDDADEDLGQARGLMALRGKR